MRTPTDAEIEEYRRAIGVGMDYGTGAAPARVVIPCPLCLGIATLDTIGGKTSAVCADCESSEDEIVKALARHAGFPLGPVYELTADGESIRRVAA